MKLFARMTILPVLGISCLLPSVEVVAQTAPAKIAYVEGKVFIKRGVDGTVEEAEVGTGVFRGDTVLTKPGGRAQVNLAASGGLRLSANTTISFPKEDEQNRRDGVITMREGQTWSNIRRLNRDEVFEVRTPTLVIAIQNGGRLYNGWVETGSPRSDEELHQQFSARGITSHWPSIPPDASKPVIALNSNITATIWHPDHPDGKYELTLTISDGVVSGTGRSVKPLNRQLQTTKFIERYSFTGTLIDNRIEGRVVHLLEVESVSAGTIYDFSSTNKYAQRLSLNLDGAVTGQADAGTWNSHYFYRNAPEGFSLKPGSDSGASEGGPLTGRWEFRAATIKKTEASQ